MQNIHIPTLFQDRPLNAIDWVFARTVQRLGRCTDPWVGLAAALVSRAAGEGHVCLDLAAAHGPAVAGVARMPDGPVPETPEQWRGRLCACAAIGIPGDFRPLILDGERLYLHRYWHNEDSLTRSILARCGPPAEAVPEAELATALATIFADSDAGQQRAARVAASRWFSVISGGPGTGKTYTVARIIRLLQALHPQRPLTIHLAAPTGKAAARLQASVQAVFATGSESVDGGAAKIHPAQTLHRLLGFMPAGAKFRYHADNPLPSDVVIVDEASMIDLALMVRLMAALSAQTRLVLVGDKDQLASVEAGAVLGDICYGVSRGVDGNGGSGGPDSGRRAAAVVTDDAAYSLRAQIAVLERSYRFDARGGIGALSRAINAGQPEAALALLGDRDQETIGLTPLDGWAALAAGLEERVLAAFGPLFEGGGPGAALETLNRFRILCAVRKGPFGVEAMNGYVEQVLRAHGRIPPAAAAPSPWYSGRPVMITRNDYYQGLFNGDVGVALDSASGAEHSVRVAFPDGQDHFKQLARHQLPGHETVYAMTVHKSQGSEFDHVVLVLPDQDLPLLTRELIYTAATRARQTLHIWAPPKLLALAVTRKIQRSSGLRDALWPPFSSAAS
ncbi:MAG: exodeoxyribonuclease V subunit alpha [Desulfatitalea sp.]|nr:exodeoxyribonuclease V subunit alpha [Desulfatitalea sp.]